MENWKNKKVVYFEWQEYYGFIPKFTATVIEETTEECLIKKRFKKNWTLKYLANMSKSEAQICGYCKLIN